MSKRRRARNKAAIPTAQQGARAAGDRVQAMTTSWYQGRNANAGFEPMPRNPDWQTSPFAPSNPLVPVPVNRPRPDGRTDVRIFELPVGWNLPGSTHRHIPWHILRDAADRISLFRRCIEIRKQHVQGLDWGFRVAKGAVTAAEVSQPGTPRARLERQLRAEMTDDINRATEFWRYPDRGNDYSFEDWIGVALEETYVLDALAIYPRKTFGGNLHSLEIPDGSTIKILRDEYARTPQPPYPAYQQILWGFPRGEFTASVDDDGAIPGAFTGDQLIYRRRNVRNWTPYGYSAVEQALDDGDLYLKRSNWMKAEYTQGSMPVGMFEVHPDAGLTAEQVADLERFYNDLLSGQTAERFKARFLPPGIIPSERGDIGEKYKADYDIFLLQKAISHFDTVLTELGFSDSKGGLGSTGYHEGQENVQERKTLALLKWLAKLITMISHRCGIASQDIEFYFLGLDDEDEAAADELEAARQEDGVIVLNERRTRLGLDPYDFPEADMPMVKTQRGIIFLEGAAALAPAGTVITPPEAKPPGQPEPDQPGDQQPSGPSGQPPAEAGQPPAQQPPAKPAPTKSPPGDNTAAAKAAEVRAYRRWATKSRSRPFEWLHHTRDEITAITGELVKSSDAGPKARNGRTWPGWEKDLAVAEKTAGRLRAAMTGAVPTRALADRWAAARGLNKDDSIDPGLSADADAWLASQMPGLNTDLAAAMRLVIEDAYTEGYLVGDVSAEVLLAEVRGEVATKADWSSWTPGDAEAARLVLDERDALTGLEQMLERDGVTIRSIATNRLSELADVLAEALSAGQSPDWLERALRDVLDDPRWARLVAVTETNRAVSTATQNRYLANGVTENDWMTAEDQRVCPVCSANEDTGGVPTGSPFPSGDFMPPAHPGCRCALGPSITIPSARSTEENT